MANEIVATSEENKATKELKLTLAGIHKLYLEGNISLAKHNEWCRQACAGATSFSL